MRQDSAAVQMAWQLPPSMRSAFVMSKQKYDE